jgi:glucose-6-phosphate isomerase
MSTRAAELWKRYCERYLADEELGFSLDVSRVDLPQQYLDAMAPEMSRALDAMEALERGAMANPDEKRSVGHYWLRAPELAPDDRIRSSIRAALADVRDFARRVHDGDLRGRGGPFGNLLLIGIGGSALGPQLLCDALGGPGDRLKVYFIDNTDPDGFDRALEAIQGELGRTLVLVVSKSGGTPEPRNAMIEVQQAYRRAGLDPAAHFLALTMEGSALDRTARAEGWVARFPMWEWVGGRTSITSPVGLLPAALQGVDIDAFLRGAAAMDRLTRRRGLLRNPAALLAVAWHRAGEGRGARDMVVLPYKDRLILFSRYLQQLVMESLGKERDRGGAVVHQGIAVYGNKGSTDQHAYVQQLRDGVHNFFVTFIQVLEDRRGTSVEVEPGITAGDYLCGFFCGTRRALYEKGRESVTITIDRVDPAAVGALVALYDRTVGLYAELIGVNAYDQPGVEAGKKAAAAVLDLQRKVVGHLRSAAQPRTAEAVAEEIGQPDEAETVFKILEHLAANRRGIAIERRGALPAQAAFRATSFVPQPA